MPGVIEVESTDAAAEDADFARRVEQGALDLEAIMAILRGVDVDGAEPASCFDPTWPESR